MIELTMKIVDNDNEQVVIKNMLHTSREVAMNPWLSLDIDYITILKGKTHIFTIIYKDGHTSSFSWGSGGMTIISESLNRLKLKVLEFLRTQNVLLGCTDKPCAIKYWKTYSVGDELTVRVDAVDKSYDVAILPEEQAMRYMKSLRSAYDL